MGVWGSQGSGLGAPWIGMSFLKPGLVLGPGIPANAAFLVVFQVNEIYHDESLGAHINVVLVRIILLSYGKVSAPTAPSRRGLLPKPPASPAALCVLPQGNKTPVSHLHLLAPVSLSPLLLKEGTVGIQEE